MKAILVMLLAILPLMAAGFAEQGSDVYFNNLTVRGVLDAPFHAIELMAAEVQDLEVTGTASIDTLFVDGFISTEYLTADMALIDTLYSSYMVSAAIVSGISGTFSHLNVDSSFYMNPVAWETFFTGMPAQEQTFDFPATQVVPINHTIGFTGLGHVPFALYQEDNDTTNVFLQFRADDDHLSAEPELRFEWLTADTLYLGEEVAFRVFHLQAAPGMSFASIDTFDFVIPVLEDTLVPGYYQSAWYTLAETQYYSQNLSIFRDTTDTAKDIGILSWTVKLPVGAPI